MKLIIIMVSTFNCYRPVGDAVTGKSSCSIVFMTELWSVHWLLFVSKRPMRLL